ncbi:IS5 family transposase [Acinetobacter gerneri]|uniref:IS5 family transposase n=1 Tax=Acinetobacter gerneri TaxID=202952 RepID=UPI003A868735
MNRGNIAIWFDPKTQWYVQSQGKHGRNQTYSDTAIQCCLMIKSLFRLSLRMVTGFVQSLIKLCGLNWTAPDYSTLCRRQKHIDIVISYQKSSDGLHLLMDSTGMKFLGEGEWKRKKHGPEYRRQWRKLHIGIDAKTLQIRAVQLTTNNISDSQVLGDLLDQIPLDEQIDSVYTDGAYDTKQCRQVIADRQAYAVIPSRKNAKPWKDNKVHSRERNELLRTVKRFGRTLWKNWSGYHHRSLVETKMHCIKLLGDKLSARNFPSQVNEVHARIAILNKFKELGRLHTQVVT